MIHCRIWPGAMIAGLAAVWSAPAQAAPPLDAYGRLPALEQVVVSPKGDRVALIRVGGDDHRHIVAQDAAGKVLVEIDAGPARVRRLEWVDEGHLMIVASGTARERSVSSAVSEGAEIYVPRSEQLFGGVLDIARKGYMNLLGALPNRLFLQIPEVRVIGGKAAVIVPTTNLVMNGQAQLFRIDAADGHTTAMASGFEDTYAWTVNSGGQMVAMEGYDGLHRRWALRIRQGQIWPQVYAIEAPVDLPGILGLSQDEQSAILLMPGEDGDRFLPVSLADGKFGTPIYESYNGLIFDRLGRVLAGVRDTADGIARDMLAPADQALWAKVKAGFPDRRIWLTSVSDDHAVMVVGAEGAAAPPAYFLADTATGSTTPVGEAYPGVTPQDLAVVRPITYPAADGLKISGFLTLPPGRDAKGLPLVVMPHGGPEARDYGDFDWEAQALASRGYAVLQPNFRGSWSPDKAFIQAGYGEWGRKMQTDLSDGVAWLAGQGIVDARRVCIVGASYGGYAALAGVTLQEGVYRCAVSYAGPSDMASMLQWLQQRSQARDTLQTRYWARYLGASTGLAAISPARHADRLSAPLLLIHGSDDTTVPIEQSRAMVEAAAHAGKTVELVSLPSTDHTLQSGQTRLQMLQAEVDFLLRNNPPG